nr:hypothetical protein Iba_chr01eCG8140 [Ipomoea batatas]
MVQNTENLIEYSKEKCSSDSRKESQKPLPAKQSFQFYNTNQNIISISILSSCNQSTSATLEITPAFDVLSLVAIEGHVDVERRLVALYYLEPAIKLVYFYPQQHLLVQWVVGY